jgi:hypothetical protein
VEREGRGRGEGSLTKSEDRSEMAESVMDAVEVEQVEDENESENIK